MRYMKLDPSYLIEQKENILHINSIDFFQGKELPLYKRKDIVILIGQDFTSLSENRNEVENSKKELGENFHKLFIADTDLNALNYIQERKVHKISDYLPIIRAFEIDEMQKLIIKNNPVNFLDDDHRKKDKVFRLVLMFVNFNTRKRKIVDVIFSETRINFDNFLKESEDNGYQLLISLTPESIEFFEAEIASMLEVNGNLDYHNIAFNKRNDFNLDEDLIIENLDERTYGNIFNPLMIFQNDINTVIQRREEKGDSYYFTLLNFLKEKLLSEINGYSEILEEAFFDNNLEAIDYYTAGRLSVDTLFELNELIEKRENAILDLINNANDLLDKIDFLLKENSN